MFCSKTAKPDRLLVREGLIKTLIYIIEFFWVLYLNGLARKYLNRYKQEVPCEGIEKCIKLLEKINCVGRCNRPIGYIDTI